MVTGCGNSGHTTKNDAVKERRTSETVDTMDTSGDLTACEQSLNGMSSRVQDVAIRTDTQSTHGIVQHWLNQGDKKGVIHPVGQVGKVESAERIILIFGDFVIMEKSFLEYIGRDFHLSRKLVTRGELFHQALPGVVDRKSTRLNSSHSSISYPVFSLVK